MGKKSIKASPMLNKLLKFTLGNYLHRKFNISVEENETKDLAPPYLVLPNHTNNFDPFIVSHYVKDPVCFVASDEYFRNPALKVLLKLVGAIPKTKFMSDMEAVKEIIKVKNNKGVIGIFPEGQRNWDGQTSELLYATAKLVKNLKIPVVTVVLRGIYLSWPRWAKHTRRGRASISLKIALTAQEVAKLSVEEIQQVLINNLDHDEYNYHSNVHNKVAFKGKKLAERLELFLFTCPHCKALGEMQSQDDTLRCTKCGYRVSYNEYGLFQNSSPQSYFINPKEWNKWQMDLLDKRLEDYRTTTPSSPFVIQRGVHVSKGTKQSLLASLGHGDIEIINNLFIFTTDSGQAFSFEIDKIQGPNVQYNDRFDFYYEGTLYRFSFDSTHASSYMWVCIFQFLHKLYRKVVAL